MTVMWLGQRCRVRSSDVLSIEESAAMPEDARDAGAARLYLAKRSKIRMERTVDVEDVLSSREDVPPRSTAQAQEDHEYLTPRFSGCTFWSA
jgi:hypothetical protein